MHCRENQHLKRQSSSFLECILLDNLQNNCNNEFYGQTLPPLTLFFCFSCPARRHDSRLLFVHVCGLSAGRTDLRSAHLGYKAPGHRQDHQSLEKENQHLTVQQPHEQPDWSLQKHFSKRLPAAFPGAGGPTGQQTRFGDIHLSPSAQEKSGCSGHGGGHPDQRAWRHGGGNLVGFRSAGSKQKTFLLAGRQRIKGFPAFPDSAPCIWQCHPRLWGNLHLNQFAKHLQELKWHGSMLRDYLLSFCGLTKSLWLFPAEDTITAMSVVNSLRSYKQGLFKSAYNNFLSNLSWFKDSSTIVLVLIFFLFLPGLAFLRVTIFLQINQWSCAGVMIKKKKKL